VGQKLVRHLPPKRAGAPKFKRIFKLQLCLLGLPELFVSVLIFENGKHAGGEMVDNVTVICPNAGIVRVKHDLDGGFRRDQDGVAPGAGDLFPINLGDFENMGWDIPLSFELTSSTRSPCLTFRLFRLG
jgi:hypothetical protein